MPMYEYHCQACGRDYEELVRGGTRDEDVVCPECGERQSRRKVSVFAFSGVKAAASSGGGGGGGCGHSGFS